MRLRQTQQNTTSQTELIGVCVYGFTLLQKLSCRTHVNHHPFQYKGVAKYLENGKAPSLANAYAILVSANNADTPVKNCIRITKNHMTVPPTLPPAFKKIWAAGIPVGDAIVASRSPRQKQNVTVSIHPIAPETTTALLIAIGPRTAASWVSSDM